MPGCSDEPAYVQSLLPRLQFRRRECGRRAPYHTHEFKLLLAVPVAEFEAHTELLERIEDDQELPLVARKALRVFHDHHTNLSGPAVRKQLPQRGPLKRDPTHARINVHVAQVQSVPLGVASDRSRLAERR
jgi:hypothetical protein